MRTSNVVVHTQCWLHVQSVNTALNLKLCHTYKHMRERPASCLHGFSSSEIQPVTVTPVICINSCIIELFMNVPTLNILYSFLTLNASFYSVAHKQI